MREISFNNLKSILKKNTVSQTNQQLRKTVSAIIEDVRKNGDKALLKYVKRFENKNATLPSLIVEPKFLRKLMRELQKIKERHLTLHMKELIFIIIIK